MNKFAIACAFALVSSKADAADWWLVGTDKPGGGNAIVLVDAESVIRTSQGIHYWQTTLFRTPTTYGASALALRVVVRCAEKESRSEEVIAYDARSSVIGSSKDDNRPWEKVNPTSLGANALALVCSPADRWAQAADHVGNIDIKAEAPRWFADHPSK